MRTRTRLLLFVLLPLVTAAGVVTWVSGRFTPAPTLVRRGLPATTQIVSGRAGLAWDQPGMSWPWGTIGLIDPGTWYGTTEQTSVSAPKPGTPAAAYARFQFQSVAGDLKSGRPHTGTTLRQIITGPGVDAAGLLYVPTDAAGVTAIDLTTQRPLWSADVGGPRARLAVAASRLVACTGDRVTCVDATTGLTLWSTLVAAGVTTAPGLTDRFACYATPDALHVLDAGTGRELHKLPTTGLTGHIAIDGQRAYVCTADDPRRQSVTLYAFDLASGSIVWKWEETGAVRTKFRPNGPVEVRGPAVGSGAVVFTLRDRLCAVDAATGQRRWLWRPDPREELTPDVTGRTLLHEALIVGTPAIIEGVVYATWQGNRVSGWDAASGREVWRYEGREVMPRTPPDIPPVGRDGLLLCVTGGEGFCALRCDLIPKTPPPPANVIPAARSINVSWAVGAASSLLLVATILAVFGLWRFMFSLACLLLCGLTLWAWVRSYPASEFVGQQTLRTNTPPFAAQARRGVLSRDGTLSFGQTHDVFQSTIRRPLGTAGKPLSLCWIREPVARWADDAPARNLLRFAWTHRSRPSGTSLGNQSEATLTLPHWVVAAILAIAPLAWLSGAWRDRRYAAGLCPWCGYDLRESKGRCSECGRAIAMSRRKR